MDTIYQAALEALLRHGVYVDPIRDATSPHSRFGTQRRRTVELTDWCIRTDRIRERVLSNPVRGARLDRAIGMAVWSLCGREDVESIAIYNPLARDFSDDGVSIRAPWGRRILHGGPRSLVGRALTILRRDPASLRAVVPVYGPGDLAARSRDIPCLQAIHFTCRGTSLHMTCLLRSLNPYWVWPYDHFFLTLLLEFCGRVQGREPGSIGYLVSSLQVDEDDLDRVRAAAATPIEPAPAMSPIPEGTSWNTLVLLDAAAAVVKSFLEQRSMPASDLEQALITSGLQPWWQEMLLLLARLYLRAADDARHADIGHVQPRGLLGIDETL